MTEQRCRLYEKTTDGTDPEPWEQVDAIYRYLSITQVSDNEALVAGRKTVGQSSFGVTHTARGLYSDEYQAGRLLKVYPEEEHYIILTIRPTGRRIPGATHSPKVRLQLAYYGEEDLSV